MQLGLSPGDLDFTYTACSGAVVDEISNQAKALSSGQEFVIVSAVCFQIGDGRIAAYMLTGR